VANVDEVVDFCSAADASFVKRATVDGGVRADFDIVFNHQASDLRGLLVAPGGGIADVAEAFTAQDCAGLYYSPVAQPCAWVDGDVGVDAAVASNYYMVADYSAGADCGFVSDLDVFSENRARADGYILADDAGWGNDGGGMDGASALRIAEKFGGSGEGEPGLRGDQKRFGCAGSDVCGREISDDDSGGGRGEGGSEMLGVFGEDQGAALGGLQAGDGGDGDGGVSEEMAAEFLG
jgi:hypothetical protein